MGARVLVIDDQRENLELMTYLLQAFGHETISAADGREGLAAAARERPDVVVMDIQMPTMDGLEAAAALKADPALRTIPLVAVTAYAMVGDREKVIAAGFDGYITKPIEPETFVRDVEAHLPLGTRRPTSSSPGVPTWPRSSSSTTTETTGRCSPTCSATVATRRCWRRAARRESRPPQPRTPT